MIFCVEDDQDIRDLMVYALKTAGYEAEGMGSAEDLYAAIKQSGALPELILLDIMLPGDDGITILRKLKAESDTAEIPVIMASAKGTEYDKVVGLDLGADDYLAKPFGMMEMVSRVRAVLRRSAPERDQQVLRIGSLEMDILSHTVTADGDPVRLTLKEYELLRLLLENSGRVFSRDQLLNRIWGMDYVGESRTVDVHVGTLRTKLGPCGDHITTVRGVGYKLEKMK